VVLSLNLSYLQNRVSYCKKCNRLIPMGLHLCFNCYTREQDLVNIMGEENYYQYKKQKFN